MQKNNVHDIDENLLRNEVRPHSEDFIRNIIDASAMLEQKKISKGFSVQWLKDIMRTVSDNLVPNPALVMACALVIGLVSGFSNYGTNDYDETEFTSIYDVSGSIL